MKAPVSLCIIVKNEPFLEKCLLSVRDYVEEVVIVDTGSTDNTPEIAKKYSNIFKTFTGCNDPQTGLIEDFSLAREYSFSLATQPWVMWCDADDIIEGCKNLNSIIEDFNKNKPQNLDAISYLFPYEYAYNDVGQCVLQHYRERLFSNKNCFRWVNPVHEVMVPKENLKIALQSREDLVFKHQRQYSPKLQESGRNLRILKKHYEKIVDADARQLYYLGLECCNSGLIDESIRHLTKYIEISGWEDERVMACLKLVDIYLALDKLDDGLRWAFKAIEIKEDWSEGYLSLAKLFYLLAMRGGPSEIRNWQKCVYFAKTGLALPPTKTLLFINPLDRECEIHKYLNMAYNKLGDVQKALESVVIGMKKQPDDPYFITNKKLYEDFLARQKVVEGTNILKQNNTIDQKTVEMVAALINNQPLTIDAKETDNIFPVASKTLSQQDWYIPETFDFSSLPIKMSDAQLQASIIMIWKQFMLHDEILSAISFLENAPYNVRDSFETQRALKLTKECLFWMDDKDEFQKGNAPTNPEVEAGNPLPNKLVMAEGHRFDLVANNLLPNSSIIDFGSMDGCFTNRYGLLGHYPVGLDVCESSVKLANKKAAEFNTGAAHICTYFQDAVGKVPAEHFDCATSTDTYEHLKDPVNDMLLPAKKMLKPNGKFLLATPHGAWMRGEYKEWAHPWLYAKEGKSWLDPFPRAHLVAPSPWSVAKDFRTAGYWVANSFASECFPQDATHQGNIFAEAFMQPPKGFPGLDIIFYAGDGVENWTPETVKKTGIGGSELMMLELAKRLASRGNRVRVYNSCGKWGEGIYSGVEYHQSNKYQDLECDVLIVSRRADMLGDQYKIKAKLKLLWVHDIYAVAATNELLLKADRILALSEWHKQFLLNYHHIHPNHVLTTRNGINLARFEKEIQRDQFKCINSSSPDRSWTVLLEIWPKIKAKVPQATLHLYYGFKNWKFSAQYDPKQMELINFIENKIKEMSSLGVVFHDRVNQEQLANEFLGAGAWLHPTWFSETSCITAMEAQAAGLRMVTSNIAALKETAGSRATLLNGEWTSEIYKSQFIDAAINALNKEDNADRIELQKYATEHFGLDSLAERWEETFHELLKRVKSNPIIPYHPTAAYIKR